MIREQCSLNCQIAGTFSICNRFKMNRLLIVHICVAYYYLLDRENTVFYVMANVILIIKCIYLKKQLTKAKFLMPIMQLDDVFIFVRRSSARCSQQYSNGRVGFKLVNDVNMVQK